MRYRILAALVLLAVLLPRPSTPTEDIDRLIALTDSLTQAVQLDSALATGRRALALAESRHGENDSTVATVVVKLGIAHFYTAQFRECEAVWKRALEIRRGIFGDAHPTTANAMVYIGVLNDQQGFSEDAVGILEKAWAVFESATEYKVGQKADCAHNLGIAYMHVRDLEKADALLEEAIRLYEVSTGPASDNVGGCLANLALVLYERGDFAGALARFDRALTILEASEGPDHPDVALTLENIGNTNVELGQYDEAADQYRRALSIKKAAFGDDHPEVASTLANLGNLYFATRQFELAEPVLLEALAIQKRTSPDGLEAARTYANLGKLYSRIGRPEEAERYYRQTIDIRETLLTPYHPSVAIALANLGIHYMEQNRYPQALECYLQALKIDEAMLGEHHPTVADILENAASICRLQSKPDSALALYDRACAIHQENLIDNGRALSEGDALVYSAELRGAISRYITAWFAAPDPSPEATEALCRTILRGKGQVSDVMFERQNMIVAEDDAETRALATELQAQRQQLADAFVRGPGAEAGEYRRLVRRLSKEIEEKETALAASSRSFQKWQREHDVTVDGIRAQIPAGAAVVEYFYYQQADLEGIVPCYGAMVIRPDVAPEMVALGEASEIDALVADYRRHFRGVAAFGSASAGDLQAYREIAGALYQRVWMPLQGQVADTEFVLVCPDGALALISFAGLPTPDGRYLVEAHTIHYLSSARDMVRFEDDAETGSGLLALGDPDYGSDQKTGITRTRSIVRGDLPDCEDFWKTVVSPLPGTRREVEQIVASWDQKAGATTVLLGGDATETALKQSASGKRAVHLATHGYYVGAVCASTPDETGAQPRASNPLLLSGLFLSGANQRAGERQTGDDGVLTAFEVTAIDLEGCALVVLSACETGLGEPEVGEGVYGLRRAFHMAGARTVVSVLWEVADQDAARLAGQLYEDSSVPVPERMRALQLDVIAGLRAQGRPDHPFSWAAFVAQRDWRR